MIKHIDEIFESDKKKIIDFCSSSCIGLKALLPLISYGTKYPFAETWVQISEGNEISKPLIISVISNFYGEMVICFDKEACSEVSSIDSLLELSSFIKAIGPREVISNMQIPLAEDNAEMGLAGHIMELPSSRVCLAKENDGIHTGKIKIIENENLKDFYDLLENNYKDHVFSKYEDWMVDLSHRIRHNVTSTSILMEEDTGKMVATAAALVDSPKAVLLGAISVNPECRGKHYAHTLVKHYADAARGKTVYIMCNPDKIGLYEKAGFIDANVFYRRIYYAE